MSYAILDNNRFYAEGLRYALLRRNLFSQIESYEIRWQSLLLTQQILVIRCRFSLSAAHYALVNILLRLEEAHWQGSLYLICNEKGWALATHLQERFTILTIYIIDDRLSVTDAAYVLVKDPRRVRSMHATLKSIEFEVLNLLISGLPVRHVSFLTNLSDKQISTHKCNALKKLNADNLQQLLI